jgi:hypothetical protein
LKKKLKCLNGRPHNVDARVLSEYQEVLKRPKFHFDSDKVASTLDYIEHAGCVVPSDFLKRAMKQEKSKKRRPHTD